MGAECFRYEGVVKMSWPRESIELWSAANLIPICMKCGEEYTPEYKDGYRTSNKCIICNEEELK